MFFLQNMFKKSYCKEKCAFFFVNSLRIIFSPSAEDLKCVSVPFLQSYDKCFLGSSETADANRVFCGQLGAVYVFSEALNPAQIFAIHQLGPSYKVCTQG